MADMATKAAKTAKVLEVAEPVVEEVIEVVETVERIPRLRLNGTTKKQQLLILGVTAGVSAAVTGVIVWKVARKREELKYERIIEQEIAETKAFYQNVNKPWPEVTVSESLDTAVEAMKGYQGRPPVEEPKKEVPAEVTTNIFVEGKPMVADAFDYDTELANRSEDTPYVISYDEFNAGEKDYVQAQLRWYDGDDVLVDDKNVRIDEVTMTVGDTVHKFGHGSKDPRIVYVRNDVMENDFEIVKDDNSYGESLGFIKHSDRPGSRKVRRMRDDEG